MAELITWLLATALFQNVLLTTGFGSSLMLRVLVRKSDILKFGGVLSFFLIATVMIDYPIDNLIGFSTAAKLLRPLLMILISIAVYTVSTLIIAHVSVPFYHKLKPYLVPAAFNNLTIGLAMIANHKVTLTIWGTLGLAVGTCLGFMLMGWLLLEGRSRLDTLAIPASFRGVAIQLLYLGLIALALLGFGGSALI